MPQGSVISSPELTYNGTSYLVSDSEVLSLSSTIAPLLPSGWSDVTIGQGLFATFGNRGALSYMIQTSDNPTVYLLDSGTERGMPDSRTYYDFQVGSGNDTSMVSPDLINFIPSGSAITSNIVAINGEAYVVSKGLSAIPSNLSLRL